MNSAATPATAPITYPCDVCGRDIPDHDGYLTIDEAALYDYPQQLAAWQAETAGTDPSRLALLTIDDLDRIPKPVRWEALHRGCDPHPQRSDYTIDIERIRSTAQLISWTAHLLEDKDWLRHSNWSQVLRSAAEPGT